MNLKVLLPAFLCLSIQQSWAQSPEETDSIKNVFKLGEVTVIGQKNVNTVSAEQIQKYGKNDVAAALNLLPGVTLTSIGARNESVVNVRGFDLRQVPLFIDGIPVYVPYDGMVDLGRFTTFDVSEVQVSKGNASVLYGPNAMGGAINVITRKPQEALEIQGATGYISGGYRTNFNVGTKWDRFYVQASFSQLNRDYFPMSKKFTPTAFEDGGKRDNSYQNDRKYHIKVAFTPTENSEYALAYSYQRGSKGNPFYAGSDTENNQLNRPRFWEWPNWDKQSLYFLSNTTIDSKQTIKTRIYYDIFKNLLNSWDDATFTTMDRGYAFTSIYNDYTIGGIVQHDYQTSKRNLLSTSVQYKQDVHREYNVGEPQRSMNDGNFTFAVEDRFKITKVLDLTAGVSYNNRRSLKAQNYNADSDEISNYPPNSNDAFNVQGAVQYRLKANQELNLSVGKKTRFATPKDRYSYRMGTAIPNPDLKAEQSVNYDLTYSNRLFNKLLLDGSLFYSKISRTILMVNNVQYDEEADMWLNQLQNTGDSEYMGFEVAANYPVSPAFSLGSNYTFIKRNNISNPEIYLMDVPRHKVIFRAGYELRDRFRVQANMEHNSNRYSTSYGTESPGFTLYNASVKLKVWKWFSLEGGVNNIFDKNYTLTEGFYEPGRVFYSNLIYKL
ncbi:MULTISPECIES: TonB-dependent siderophore receptor [unclassified Sphingobacterium]|uniref:TonB-dependent receptor plug domain-containing protein n=1 Tax=unclassified Sphingobacterium TaxID=2609468 RepID=UPI0025F8583A|nr:MULTISPECIES: TonB-dependent receptor [unclassified Sphingobacterium]